MSLMKKALLYAEGSKKIGMGHLNRMVMLQRVLRSQEAFETRFITRKDENARQFLKSRAADPFFWENSEKGKISQLCRYVDAWNPDVLVLDVLEEKMYECFEHAQKKDCRSVAVVDYSRWVPVPADLIVNGNPALNEHCDNPIYFPHLLGTDCFMMDPEYAECHVDEPSGEVKRVLLTLGGSDHNDLIFKFLDVFETIFPDLEILVVTSTATGYIRRLKDRLKSSRLKSELYADLPGLVSSWGKADVAITAGGNTLFERIASRLPGATLCQLPRQMKIAERFQEFGVNFNLGFGPELSEADLGEKLTRFINNRSAHIEQYRRSPAVVDGKALFRIGKSIGILVKRVSNGLC